MLFADKKEPFLFCYKVCPLYCPDLLHHRRSDDESVTYFDEDYPSKGYHEEEQPSPAPKAYIYENTGHQPYTHIDHIPYPPYPDTRDYPDHASWAVEDKSHGGRACHGCHGHHGGHSHHPWKHKPFEVEYNVKYVFKPIYPTTTKKEPATTEATTTKAPSTTPKELTGICYACLKKCDFYGFH
ncbi:hypothetical protein JYU34_001758 [Plutella xylostella]|uniref:Uncharacterized protein n=1 Tax=Plutella xylostella TaxID=51655 RepID=A0ABQ7R4T3_PLUXY|nr:hypothetical protein JYU34_001758 [Plutella xylostella]